MARRSTQRLLLILAIWVVGLVCTGCRTAPLAPHLSTDMPTELNRVAHPEYTLAPPDILLIDAVTLIPRPPYRIAPLDALLIRVVVAGVKDPDKVSQLVLGYPIDGLYRVEVDGNVDLGVKYGTVKVVGLTIPEARKAMTEGPRSAKLPSAANAKTASPSTSETSNGGAIRSTTPSSRLVNSG